MTPTPLCLRHTFPTDPEQFPNGQDLSRSTVLAALRHVHGWLLLVVGLDVVSQLANFVNFLVKAGWNGTRRRLSRSPRGTATGGSGGSGTGGGGTGGGGTGGGGTGGGGTGGDAAGSSGSGP